MGDSEKAAVEHAPRNPIPALDHENADDFRKVSASVATEKSGNILEDKPTGSKLAQDARKLIKESSAFPGEPGPSAGDGDILARDACADEVNAGEAAGAALADVFVSPCIRKMPFENRPAEWLDFYLPGDRHASALKAEVETADAGEQ